MNVNVKKGFSRLFILLFAAWVIYWVGYVPWNSYHTSKSNLQYWIQNAEKESLRKPDPKYQELIKRYEDELSKLSFPSTFEAYKSKALQDRRKTALVLLGVPAGFFLAIYLFISFIKWIVVGFTGREVGIGGEEETETADESSSEEDASAGDDSKKKVETQLKRKRPGWVWAITIFYFISAAFMAFSFFLVFSGKVPVNSTQQAYFERLSTLDYIVTSAVAALGVVGAVLLFMLRKAAFHIFLGALVFSILSYAKSFATAGFVQSLTSSGVVGMVMGLLVNVLILRYVYLLKKRDVLR